MKKIKEKMERSRDWIEQAKSDLEIGFYEWACFSSQQAAEKGVKAVFQKMVFSYSLKNGI